MTWNTVLQEEMEKPYFKELLSFLEEERKRFVVYPPKELVSSAFLATPYDKVKVVIVGQDPYHGVGQAHGMCFSVQKGVKPPPSLQNIYRELQQDVGIDLPTHGCLQAWADQGVFLLNALLTVRASEPGSHKAVGWERFTDAVVAALAKKQDPLVFLLWGKFAQEKCAQLLQGSRHLVLVAAHPSPYSAHSGFFGCSHFSKANAFLEANGKTPINWSVK